MQLLLANALVNPVCYISLGIVRSAVAYYASLCLTRGESSTLRDKVENSSYFIY